MLDPVETLIVGTHQLESRLNARWLRRRQTLYVSGPHQSGNLYELLPRLQLRGLSIRFSRSDHPWRSPEMDQREAAAWTAMLVYVSNGSSASSSMLAEAHAAAAADRPPTVQHPIVFIYNTPDCQQPWGAANFPAKHRSRILVLHADIGEAFDQIADQLGLEPSPFDRAQR